MNQSQEVKQKIMEAISSFENIEELWFSPALNRWVVRISGGFNSVAMAGVASCGFFDRGEIFQHSPYAFTLYFKNEED